MVPLFGTPVTVLPVVGAGSGAIVPPMVGAISVTTGRGVTSEGVVATPEPALDVVALDRALEALAAVDVRQSRVIELRFFGGLSVEETAEVLHVSSDTVKRDWRLAKLWLLRELEGEAR